jgi:hypothetical protein
MQKSGFSDQPEEYNEIVELNWETNVNLRATLKMISVVLSY